MIITALKSLSGQIMIVFLAATAAWGVPLLIAVALIAFLYWSRKNA